MENVPTFIFDGPGIVLAHAYIPHDDTCREIHLNSSEKWLHSSVQDSIMFPYYNERKIFYDLLPDDIHGIQSLYGPPNTKPTTAVRIRTTAKKIIPTRKSPVLNAVDNQIYQPNCSGIEN
ncbi:hypothetical protein WA026_022997 [Henosepilachna vigintioctopunctata]|uniref:Peptidase M10 metallopeptidase domain-containing protein n=1 Tax=Henosepilachna vigintioctopunctata TaxID=420089 RepID=A0AAW1USG9_9CUCU